MAKTDYMTYPQAFQRIESTLLPLYGPGEATSMAAIVLEDAFGRKPGRANRPLDPSEQQRLEQILARLLAHEPVQYVLGMALFYGLVFQVGPAVLIPRQETEELVAWVLDSARAGRLLDIGTGSGCIPVSIKKKRPDWGVHALDISPEALETARANARSNHADVHFHHLDILDEKAWEALPSFDTVVSNPPYILEEERPHMPKNVLDFEPHLALFTGNDDAQRFIKKIADFSRLHLVPGGCLFLETNEFHAAESKRVLEERGFESVEIRQDLNGKDRMIRACQPLPD